MKKFKSLAILGMAAALSVTALSGCGGGSSSSEGSEAAAEPANKLEAIKASGKIVMATSPDFAPYEFENINGTTTEYAGADIELGKYIAEQLGVELEIEAMDFSAVQAAVTTGSVDMAISGFSQTPDREESMGLSHGYKTNSDGPEQGLLILKENADALSTKESFNGKKVAAQNGALQQQLVTEQLPDAVMEPIGNSNDAIMMLTTGKVDAFATATKVGDSYIQNYPELCFSDFYFDYNSPGNVVAVTKGEDELLDAINDIIDDVMEKNLYQQWFDESTELAQSLGLMG